MRTALIVAALVAAGCSEYDVRPSPKEVEVTDTDVPVVDTDPPEPDPEPELVSGLEITPVLHDFGVLGVPCTDSVELTLTSVGDIDLTITDVNYVSSGVLALNGGALQLPLVLPPGDSVTVLIEAITDEPGVDVGSFEVTSDAPEGLTVAQQAVEAEGSWTTETFSEPGIPPVDILFLIDQSCSMQALAQDNIEDGMPAFITELQGVADWQIIEVTKSDGCANGGIINPSTPNAAQRLADNAFNVFLPGPYSEQLLKHAELALSRTGPGQCNDGFLRPGASLHILVASDEAEQSFQNWNYWLNAYYPYVANPQYVKVSGILNLFSDDVCSDYNGGSPDGYIEIVQATGGVALDICAPGWGTQLTDIATATVAGMRVYNLTDDAVPNTLEVLVNGVPATDWAFNNGTNSVTINEPAIGEGDEVEVTYGVYAGCN